MSCWRSRFSDSEPVSVMMINGTDDQLVPIGGGRVGGPFVAQGFSIPVSDAVWVWTNVDGCKTTPQISALPDVSPSDGTSAEIEQFLDCRLGTTVQLWTITGGGHTWPDGPQYLPKAIIGNVSHNFDASEAIWQFFAAHPRT